MPAIERLVFFGTPALAVPTLEALCAVRREPLLVVTQPARRAGRGQRLRQPPVADWALAQGLLIEQPPSVRRPEFLERMRQLAPDLVVVVAFGQIFPPALLQIPVGGCVNLHASLLPRHRGAAPIQAAIAAGDRTTGVTTMMMDEGLDTGPSLLSEEVVIGERETGGELGDRLARLGGELVVRTIEALENGTLDPHPQDGERATYAALLTREDGRVDWSASAMEIERRLRAYTPWPGCFTELRGESVKILAAEVTESPASPTGVPGTCLGLDGDSLRVGCGAGSVLALARVQRPGKRPVSGRDLANGLRIEPGDRFG